MKRTRRGTWRLLTSTIIEGKGAKEKADGSLWGAADTISIKEKVWGKALR